MSIALARNMATVSTNNPCFGKTCECVLLRNLSAGVTWLRLLTTCWFSRATWLDPHCARGKTGIASPPCNRCVAGRANCCHSLVPLRAPHTLAENRRDEQKGPGCARLSAFRLSEKRQKGRNWSFPERLARIF